MIATYGRKRVYAERTSSNDKKKYRQFTSKPVTKAQVVRMLKKSTELRGSRTVINYPSIPTGYSSNGTLLSDVEVGPEYNQRDGRKIHAEKLHWKLQAIAGGNTVGGASTGTLRLIIWRAKTADFQGIGQVLGTDVPNSTVSTFSIQNQGMYKILYDETIPLNTYQHAVGVGNFAPFSYVLSGKVKLGFDVEWNKEGKLDNPIYACIICSEPNYAAVNGSFLLTFRDV